MKRATQLRLTQVRILLSAISICATFAACSKVPLRAESPRIDFFSAHWFENEKVEYVFFSVNDLKSNDGIAKSGFFEISRNGAEYQPLDPANAVHTHTANACGDGAICGSYSYRADQPSRSLKVRFRYHKDSPLAVETYGYPSSHMDGDGASAQSALVYGVFDAKNERVQIRVHDNFGSPNSSQTSKYGLIRSFEANRLSLASIPYVDQVATQAQTGTALLSPALPCAVVVTSQSAAGDAHRFSDRESWWPQSLKSADNEQIAKNAACFQVRALDHRGVEMRTLPAMARRNPELADERLAIDTPLGEARKIPVVLSYCQEAPGGAALTSRVFLDYQRFILGISDSPIDACFAVGEETRFAADMERLLTQKLKNARQTGTNGEDFIFVFAINHKLAPLVRQFHSIIAEKLKAVLALESRLVSPRLVGAFVYDSQATDIRPYFNGPGVISCPRIEPKEASSQASQPVSNGDANCSAYAGGRLEIGPVNFLIPMGPFPTLDTYIDYNNRYGDEGRSRNPQLVLNSVRTNVNSHSDTATYTFLDGERLNLDIGQGLHYCAERDNDRLGSSVAVRVAGSSEISPLSNLDSVTSQSTSRITVEVGLHWEHPFLGALTYESPIEGKVLSFIPVSTSVGNSQKIGDQKWSRPQWSVGRLLQRCIRHCDHPFFDESGTYQAERTWRQTGYCPSPKIAEPAP